MGWLTDDYLRLRISMRFNLRLGVGFSSVEFIPVLQHPTLTPIRSSILLAVMTYLRILISHAETRRALYERIDAAAQRLRSGNTESLFDEWVLEVRNLRLCIWPWVTLPPRDLSDSRRYVATLRRSRRNVFAYHLKMAWGQERILAPSAVLLAISALAGILSRSDAALLGRTLCAVNDYYMTADSARLFTKQQAIAAAVASLGDADLASEAPAYQHRND